MGTGKVTSSTWCDAFKSTYVRGLHPFLHEAPGRLLPCLCATHLFTQHFLQFSNMGEGWVELAPRKGDKLKPGWGMNSGKIWKHSLGLVTLNVTFPIVCLRLRHSFPRIAQRDEQAGGPVGSGTTSQHIGNASHDTGTPAQVCSRRVMRTGG